MRAIVRSTFVDWSTQFESMLDFLYCDVKRLVTTGLGNLVDSIAAVRGLIFIHKDGRIASQAEIVAYWNAVKHSTLDPKAGGAQYATLSDLRIVHTSLDKLIASKLDEMETQLRLSFTTWNDFPADAQLACLSMAWAMGQYFVPKWPHYKAACDAHDWVQAAANCHMSETSQNSSFHHRNDANVALFVAASTTTDPELLHV